MKQNLKTFAFLLLSILAFSSCKKGEEKLEATADLPDAFVRMDSQTSAADHQIFLVYQQTGVPILYGDTLSKSPVTTLGINYRIGGADSNYKLRYLKQQQDILTGVNFVKNEILTRLTKRSKPYCVLMLDSLLTLVRSPITFQYADAPVMFYVGANTLAIGNVTKIANMGTDSLNSYKAYILAGQLTAKLNLQPALLSSFYAVSSAYYTKTIGPARKETYGLIPIGTEGTSTYYANTQLDDFTRYLRLYLTSSPAALQTRFQAYPLVLNKLNFLQQALTTIGYVQ